MMPSTVNELGDYEEYATLTLAVSSIKSGLEALSFTLEESISEIMNDLVEPIETFTKVY